MNAVRSVNARGTYHSSIGRVPPVEPPFLVNFPGRSSNLLYKSTHLFFFPIQFGFLSPFFTRLRHTQQNSFLDAHFSGSICHHHPLLVLHPPLVSTTRQNMPAAQNNVSFTNVNLATDMRKTSLPNLSYPIRPIHNPWVESSAPLVIAARYLQWPLQP